MIRVLLLDDHAVVRRGYRQLIDAEPDMQVLAEAATTAQACAASREHAIDVAVVDLNLKDDSGLEAIRRLRQREPRLQVLVFTMHGEGCFALQAWRAGALGYLTKDSDPLDMLAALRQVAAGRRAFSAPVMEALLAATPEQGSTGTGPWDCLTPREFEVLRLATDGVEVPRIAQALHLSDKTIQNNLSVIRQKLGTANDFQLWRLALRHGLTQA